MASIKIRYLSKKPGRGGTIRYFWTPGPALRKAGWFSQRLAEDTGLEHDAIREAEDLNARVDAWRKGEDQAVGKDTPAPRGSINELVKIYRTADEFKDLKPKTQRRYLQNIKVIEAWCGDAPIAAITAKKIKTYYKSLKINTPGKAVQMVGMMRILLSFAMSEDMLDHNPAKDVKIKHNRRAKNESDIWTGAAIKAFVKAAGEEGFPSIGTAVALNAWLGQREGDLLELPANTYRDGVIQFIQSKTGAEVYLPVDMVQELAQHLEEERQRQKSANVTATTLLVCESTGKAWNEHTFRAVFRKIRARAATDCPECATVQFQRLRHTAITHLAEAGVDPAGITSITGHSLQTINQILEHYLVRTKKMATNAFTKRLAAEAWDTTKNPK